MKVTNTNNTGTGPKDWFTGTVYIDPITAPADNSQLMAGNVHFTPGAHTAWHTHPRGQTLFLTEGSGLVASRGGPAQLIKPGDVVHIAANEEHWHGAIAKRFMVHIAMNEVDETGNGVSWLEHVEDAEYQQANKLVNA